MEDTYKLLENEQTTIEEDGREGQTQGQKDTSTFWENVKRRQDFKKKNKKGKKGNEVFRPAKRVKSRVSQENVTKGRIIKTVLTYITKAATDKAPKQFELPPEIYDPFIFPETDEAVPGASGVNLYKTSAGPKEGSEKEK